MKTTATSSPKALPNSAVLMGTIVARRENRASETGEESRFNSLCQMSSDKVEVVLLHFVAEPRIAALLGDVPECHHKATSWPEAQKIVFGVLTGNTD